MVIPLFLGYLCANALLPHFSHIYCRESLINKACSHHEVVATTHQLTAVKQIHLLR